GPGPGGGSPGGTPLQRARGTHARTASSWPLSAASRITAAAGAAAGGSSAAPGLGRSAAAPPGAGFGPAPVGRLAAAGLAAVPPGRPAPRGPETAPAGGLRAWPAGGGRNSGWLRWARDAGLWAANISITRDSKI